MTSLLQVFGTKNAAAHEEALMAAGALADKLEDKFMRYMAQFKDVVMMGLRNHEEFQVCTVAVGVVGDLSRALGKALAQFCNEIVQALLEILQVKSGRARRAEAALRFLAAYAVLTPTTQTSHAPLPSLGVLGLGPEQVR